MAVKRVEIPAVSGRGKDIRKKESGWVRQINTMEVMLIEGAGWQRNGLLTFQQTGGQCM